MRRDTGMPARSLLLPCWRATLPLQLGCLTQSLSHSRFVSSHCYIFAFFPSLNLLPRLASTTSRLCFFSLHFDIPYIQNVR